MINVEKIKPMPEMICDILVEHGQHDIKFKLGETIKYSPSEVLKILREHEKEIDSSELYSVEDLEIIITSILRYRFLLELEDLGAGKNPNAVKISELAGKVFFDIKRRTENDNCN